MAGSPVITMADFSSWLVATTDLTELLVVDLKVGDHVTIQVDSLPGASLKGKVIAISKTASVVRGDVTYPVKIELEDTGELPLRWGMTVFVDIDVNE